MRDLSNVDKQELLRSQKQIEKHQTETTATTKEKETLQDELNALNENVIDLQVLVGGLNLISGIVNFAELC